MSEGSPSSRRGFRPSGGLDPATGVAMLGSGLMIAQMVAAKALRDSVFLSAFPVSALPLMTLVAAAVAIVASVGGARLVGAWTPARMVPGAFMMSAVLQMGEFALYAMDARAAAVAIFLHVFALNLILTSAFWSLMTEHFDPRSAQRAFGRITGMGTVGGMLGGLAAERTAAWGSIPLLIAFGAILHVACGATMWWFARTHHRGATHKPKVEKKAAREAFQRSPYLIELAGLVVTVSIAAALLDFLFKSQAAETVGTGVKLTQFFAWFYMATSVLSAAMQVFATPWLLARLGLASTLRSLPLAIVAGGGGLLIFSGFAGLTLLRGLEVVLRGSMFRSAYELFHTPVAAAEKRAAKGIIDVGGERLGDALGSGLIALLLLARAGPAVALGAAVGFAGLGVVLARRLQQSYVTALESSLADQSSGFVAGPLEDRSEIFQLSALPTAEPEAEMLTGGLAAHPEVRQLLDLRSPDESRVWHALVKMETVDPLVCPQLIRLLAHDRYAFLAMERLKRVARRHAGQLADALLDAGESVVVRRRIPFVLAVSQSQVALDALTEALHDREFQVRMRSAHAMLQLRLNTLDLRFAADRVWKILEAELQQGDWAKRQPVGAATALDDPRVDYLFALLRLLLPAEPVLMAQRALSTQDRHLRGTALEYLQTVLPLNVWKQVEARIADRVVILPGTTRES